MQRTDTAPTTLSFEMLYLVARDKLATIYEKQADNYPLSYDDEIERDVLEGLIKDARIDL